MRDDASHGPPHVTAAERPTAPAPLGPPALLFPQFRDLLFLLQERVQREVYHFSAAEIARRNAEPGRTAEARRLYELVPPTEAALVAHARRAFDPAHVTNQATSPRVQAARIRRWAAFARELDGALGP